MPAAFIGHGSPLNTLETNRFTSVWQALGRTLPRPRAILAISAHWFIHGTALTAMPKPRVIHDFRGFPKALFDFQYPAPGAPDIAQEIADLLKPDHVALDIDSWGLDHGTWSVLAHVYPKADIPVIQLSINAREGFEYHFELGKKLAPLRERGILIIGSGNVVHNLGEVDWTLAEGAFDWAQAFDAAVMEAMTTAPETLVDVLRHPAYALAVPTPEHFLPLAYQAGLSAAAGQPSTVLVEGGTLGAITMTSYGLGCTVVAGSQSSEAAAPLPDPAVVPPQNTNT